MKLETSYLGLSLKHPLVASASPLSYKLAGIKQLEDAGAAAVVMHSLFEEQIEQESQALHHYMDYGSHSFAEALDYFPEPESFRVGPTEYLNLLSEAKKATDIPIIASLNGSSPGGWTYYAKLIEEAGADGLELNIYHIPTDTNQSSQEVEQLYLDILSDVRSSIGIPIAVKLSPYFSATANMALRLANAGADALVLFNRFYQPDIDIENLEVIPHLNLSSPAELTLPLRWIAILYGRIPADLALTSGVHSHLEVLKGLMSGASVTMMTSALLQKGPEYLNDVLQNLTTWLVENEYKSVVQMQGSMSQLKVADKDAFERANYMKVLQSWKADPTGSLQL